MRKLILAIPLSLVLLSCSVFDGSNSAWEVLARVRAAVAAACDCIEGAASEAEVDAGIGIAALVDQESVARCVAVLSASSEISEVVWGDRVYDLGKAVDVCALAGRFLARAPIRESRVEDATLFLK